MLKPRRIFYLAATLILLAVEVLIALYVHDQFIRPYMGDVLVMIVLYCFVQIWNPDGWNGLPLFLFLFAVGVEILQYFQLPAVLGVEHNPFLRIVLGSVFDLKDILCYGVGSILLALFQRWEKADRQ